MSPPTETAVSLGYDRVRFLGAVYFGDTITVNYTVTENDEERPRSSSTIKVVNQKGDVGSYRYPHPEMGFESQMTNPRVQ